MSKKHAAKVSDRGVEDRETQQTAIIIALISTLPQLAWFIYYVVASICGVHFPPPQ